MYENQELNLTVWWSPLGAEIINVLFQIILCQLCSYYWLDHILKMSSYFQLSKYRVSIYCGDDLMDHWCFIFKKNQTNREGTYEKLSCLE